jgi:hypothetical protein
MTETKTITERPALFKGRLIRGILDGSKTQTRRPLKVQPPSGVIGFNECAGDLGTWYCESSCVSVLSYRAQKCPFGRSGDRLWVRESFHYGWYDEEYHYNGLSGESITESRWARCDDPDEDDVWYAADGDPGDPGNHDRWDHRQTPSIHMPRWASRIDLEVLGVRVEQLQDLSVADALAEGVKVERCDHAGGKDMYGCVDCLNTGMLESPVEALAHTWDEIYAKQGLGWSDNPWVWVTDFRRVRP